MSNRIHLIEQDIYFDITDEETILEAALRQGHNLPYACRNGLCGSCKAVIQTGEFFYPTDIAVGGLTKTEIRQGYGLLCQAQTKTNLSIQAQTLKSASDIKTRQLPCRVVEYDKLNNDVIQLKLALPKTERFQFMPGQYIDILMQEGKRRSFSLANPPHEDQLLELHIRYYKGGVFSEYAFNNLKEKTLLRIEGPHGQFTLQESDRPMIMIAGGTGFAPIKSLIEYTLENDDRRSIDLYWGAKAESDLYLNEMARHWSEEYTHINYTPALSDIDKLNGWQGRSGFIHDVVMQDYSDLSAHDIYSCGPPAMINALVETLPKQGLNKERFFSDSFEFTKS